jgi:hypothetical protein
MTHRQRLHALAVAAVGAVATIALAIDGDALAPIGGFGVGLVLGVALASPIEVEPDDEEGER